MWTLIRYEMRKTMQIKIISVSLIAIFEFLLLFGSTSGNIAVMGLAGVFLFFFSFVAFLLFGLSSMASLSKDLSTNQGYMLFMLPKPSYTFLLAKILESLLSTFCLSLLLYFLFLFDIFFFSVDVASFMDVFKMVWGLTMESRLGDFIHFMISIALIYAGFWLYMSCLAVLCVTVQGENLGFPYFNHCIFVPGGQHCGVVRDSFGEDSGFGRLGQPNEFSSADPFLDVGISSLLWSFRLYTGKEEKLLIPFHL